MNKGVLYYIFLNRIRDKSFLLFYIVGAVLYFITFYFSMPFNEDSFEFFRYGIAPFFSIYFSIISGINGLGKDEGRGYFEILLTKPIRTVELLLGYYVIYVISSLLFLIVVILPTVFYYAYDFHSQFNGLIISCIVEILFYTSFTIFFSNITRDNMYIASMIILIISPMARYINKKLEIIQKIFFPQAEWRKLVIVVVILTLSLFFIRRKRL